MADVKELNINSTTYDIKAKTVVNQNGGSIKYWTGTRAQYEAIATKDANTLYNITDDTDVALSLLELLYPVGSLYIASGNLSTCPLSVLGIGTWTLKTVTTLVTNVNGTATVVGNGVAVGLTDGTNFQGLTAAIAQGATLQLGGFSTDTYGSAVNTSGTNTNAFTNGRSIGLTTDPTKSGIEANVTSTTLAVTIWERTS